MKRFIGDFAPEAYEFMEQHADDLWDFMLCKRDDGTIYGTAGQCRKGVETQAKREEVLEDLKKRGAKVEEVGPLLQNLTDVELANVAKNAAELIGQSRGRKVGAMDWETIENLDKNRDRLLEGFEDPSKLTGNLRKVSDGEANAFYSLLPTNIKNNLKKAGSLNNDQYLQEDGSHGPPNEWRARQLAKRWLEQDGKDLYTGLPLRLADADMEHIIPHKTGGNRSESLDNFGWVNYSTNSRKANKSMEDFLGKEVDKGSGMGREKYLEKVYNPSVKKAKLSDLLEKESIFHSKNPSELSEEVIKQFGKKLYYVTREWGVKHGYKGGRKQTRYFSNRVIPGTKEKFTEAVVRRWPNLSDDQRTKVIKVSEFISESLTRGLDSAKVMARAKEEMQKAGFTFG